MKKLGQKENKALFPAQRVTKINVMQGEIKKHFLVCDQ